MTIYVIYTNREEGLYQIYNPRRSRSLRGLYMASKMNHSIHSLRRNFGHRCCLNCKNQTRNLTRVYIIYLYRSGHDFSMCFAYKLFIKFSIYFSMNIQSVYILCLLISKVSKLVGQFWICFKQRSFLLRTSCHSHFFCS